MEGQRVSCVVMIADGASRRVGPNGLMIGRKHDCDLVSEDPSVSRRHALIRVTSDGAEVVPLGRGPIEVNGKTCEQPKPLSDGDRVAVPGLEVTVRVEALPPNKAGSSTWRLIRVRGGSFGIVHSPFLIGGGGADDLIVKRWPQGALRFHLAQGDLYFEAAVPKVKRNGADVEVGATEPVAVGDEIEFRGETFSVRQSGHAATTVATRAPGFPTRIAIEILPRGGRAVFDIAGEQRAVFLSDRRLDLLVALVKPPEGYAAGEFIPDEVVATTVWPRNPGVTRTEINVLISRLRRDLVEAGLAGARLVERAPGGGATRMVLAKGADVVVES
ncbi:MAG: FHA domain-containing protein [Kofleriaceae bacterium]